MAHDDDEAAALVQSLFGVWGFGLRVLEFRGLGLRVGYVHESPCGFRGLGFRV